MCQHIGVLPSDTDERKQGEPRDEDRPSDLRVNFELPGRSGERCLKSITGTKFYTAGEVPRKVGL